jgi:hypothetical protein
MPHLFGGLRSWLGRIARGAAVLIVVAVVSGALYQNVLLARDRRANPMPGELVDVGGYKMHIYCAGRGSPPVILDSGQGDSYISWRKVQPEIAKFVSVCSYDRAGLGYSEPSPRPSTSRVFAEELTSCLMRQESLRLTSLSATPSADSTFGFLRPATVLKRQGWSS